MTYLKEYLKVRTSLYVNANTKKYVNPKKYQEEKSFYNRETNSFLGISPYWLRVHPLYHDWLRSLNYLAWVRLTDLGLWLFIDTT